MRKPRGNRRPGGSFSKAARCMCSNRSRRGVELSSGRLGASSTRCQPRTVTSSPGCPLSSTSVRLKYRRTQVDRRVGLPRGIVAGSIRWQLRSPGPARDRCRRACVGRRRVTFFRPTWPGHSMLARRGRRSQRRPAASRHLRPVRWAGFCAQAVDLRRPLQTWVLAASLEWPPR
jgi:hypothetical protein